MSKILKLRFLIVDLLEILQFRVILNPYFSSKYFISSSKFEIGDPGSGVKLAAASLGQTSVQISNTIFINNAMAVYQDQFSYLTLTNNKFYNNTATYTIQVRCLFLVLILFLVLEFRCRYSKWKLFLRNFWKHTRVFSML
jgi:hypothetical protein